MTCDKMMGLRRFVQWLHAQLDGNPAVTRAREITLSYIHIQLHSWCVSYRNAHATLTQAQALGAMHPLLSYDVYQVCAQCGALESWKQLNDDCNFQREVHYFMSTSLWYWRMCSFFFVRLLFFHFALENMCWYVICIKQTEMNLFGCHWMLNIMD